MTAGAGVLSAPIGQYTNALGQGFAGFQAGLNASEDRDERRFRADQAQAIAQERNDIMRGNVLARNALTDAQAAAAADKEAQREAKARDVVVHRNVPYLGLDPENVAKYDDTALNARLEDLAKMPDPPVFLPDGSGGHHIVSAGGQKLGHIQAGLTPQNLDAMVEARNNVAVYLMQTGESDKARANKMADIFVSRLMEPYIGPISLLPDGRLEAAPGEPGFLESKIQEIKKVLGQDGAEEEQPSDAYSLIRVRGGGR
jgi:hypothetical protein